MHRPIRWLQKRLANRRLANAEERSLTSSRLQTPLHARLSTLPPHTLPDTRRQHAVDNTVQSFNGSAR